MRQILTRLLILMVFASATICCCDHVARAEQAVSPNHVHMAAGHNGTSGGCGHDGDKKAPDCRDKTMQFSASASIAKPDLKNSLHLDYVRINEKPSWPPLMADATTIRGPPFGGYLPDPPLPVYLTTQRLRI